jgi:Protein of unknown function (DUF3105)
VQAPRRRSDTRAGGPFGSFPRWAWAVGAAAVVGLALVAAFAFGGGGSSSGTSEAAVAKAMKTAGCSYKSAPPKPPKKNPTNYHVDVPSLTTPTNNLWSTFPPSAGAHYGLWAVWGFYRQAVNPRQVVHNEEHGGVIIWWGNKVPASTIDKLRAFYDSSPNGMLGTPYPSLGNKIALTAWTSPPSGVGEGHLATCSAYSDKAFTAFRDAYRGRGPERYPLDTLTPGA